MLKKGNKKCRLVSCLILCTLFIALSVSQAMGKSVNDSTKNNLLRFFIHDWNWWDNKPDMYMIPSGNVGIGTTSPSMKLDVMGSINATPILGKWAQNHTRVGWGNFTWDVQLLNTDPTCLNWTVAGEHIIVLKNGYYQININVCQYFPYQTFPHKTAGVVFLKRNNDVLSTGQCCGDYSDVGFSHHFSDVGYFNANDSVSVYSQSSNEPYANRLGDGLCSTMNIIRLN